MKPWDDIVLTDEEKEAAIVEGKKRKWFHERNKEYWDAQVKKVGFKERSMTKPLKP